MDTSRSPFLKSLSHRGFIRGVTISSNATHAPLCHFYGRVRYALAPSQRWRSARPLPRTYVYGTEEAPGVCDEGAGVCPQPTYSGLPKDMSRWTEDCFQCNVSVPIGEPPSTGMLEWTGLQRLCRLAYLFNSFCIDMVLIAFSCQAGQYSSISVWSFFFFFLSSLCYP